MIPWNYVTRALGVFMVLYGVLVDHSEDRGTIIIGGMGLFGADRVLKSDEKTKK
jgi:hypothetical protein